MNKKMLVLLSTLVVASMMLAACGPTTPPETEGPTEAQTGAPAEPFLVGFVTDTGGIDDDSFNEAQWNGVLRAQAELPGVEAQFIQSDEATQYTANLTEFASQGYDVIIAAGYYLGEDVANVAGLYPDINFAVFDYAYPDPFLPADNPGSTGCIPNVMGIIFRTDQAAFLAGYVSAGVALDLDPEDPALGYFGGAKIPSVTIFGVGFEAGMDYYNEVHGTNVRMIGWSNETGDGLFTGDFEDLVKGKEYAESLFDQGADIFMGVGGIIGAPGFDVARERGGYGVWVDSDGYYTVAGAQDVVLTSVLKFMEPVAFDFVKNSLEGNFEGCSNFVGGIHNDGVGLAPYHDLDSVVSDELKAEVDDIMAKIKSGEITDTGCISYPLSCAAGLYD